MDSQHHDPRHLPALSVPRPYRHSKDKVIVRFFPPGIVNEDAVREEFVTILDDKVIHRHGLRHGVKPHIYWCSTC